MSGRPIVGLIRGAKRVAHAQKQKRIQNQLSMRNGGEAGARSKGLEEGTRQRYQ